MNPYEKTANEMKRQSEERPKQLAKNALAIGSTLATAGSFAPILARAAPFLSEYIPEVLAIKGLSKINPKMGNFVKKAMDDGFDFNEVKNFIGEQISDSQKPQGKGNIIEQYSPELHQYIKDEKQKGKSGLSAITFPKFKTIIEKLTNDHKASFADILKSVYGDDGLAEQQQPAQNQPNSANNSSEINSMEEKFGKLMDQRNQPQQGQQQPNNQNQQMRQAAFEKIMKM